MKSQCLADPLLPTIALALAFGLAAWAGPASAQEIFSNDFESGDASAWSAVVPADPSPPMIVIVEPLDVVNTPVPQVTVTFEDPESGLNLSRLTITIDGNDLLPRCTIGRAQATCIPEPLEAGDHDLAASIRNQHGAESTAMVSFAVELIGDLTPPLVFIDAPTPADTFERSVAIVARYLDTESDLALATLAILLDGIEQIAFCTVDVASVVCPQIVIATGSHSVTVSIEDEAGNLGSVTTAWTVLDDATAPTLTLLDPIESSQIFNQGQPRVLATYDDGESGIDVETVTLTIDGADRTSSCDITFDRADCRPTLAAGAHVASFTVLDQVGNSTVADRGFILIDDTVPPTIGWVAPANGAVFEVPPPIEIAYTDAEAGVDLASLRVQLDAADITGSCTVGASNATCVSAPALAEGVHHLSAEIVDSAGNIGTADVSFTFVTTDRIPPTLIVVSPQPGSTVSGDASPTIEVSYADVGGGIDSTSLLVQIDETDVSSTCQADATEATCTAPSLLAGPHQLHAQIRDLAGNFTAQTVGFSLQSQLSVAISAPGTGFVTQADTVDLSGTVDPSATSVEVGGIAGVLGGGTFDVIGVPLQEGSNTLAAIARDPDGGIGTATVTVVKDTKAPRVVIATPRDGLVTTAPQIAITGEVRDLVSSNVEAQVPRVTINGVSATVEQNAFMVSDFLLQSGENRIRARALDDAGNEGDFEITVTYLTGAALKIEEMLGNGQRATVGQAVEQPLIVRATDFLDRPLANRDIVFRVTRGDGHLASPPREGREVIVASDELGFARVLFTLGSRSGAGNHEVTASSPGIPGETVFCLEAMPGPAQRIKRIRGDNQLGAEAGIAGAQLPKPLLAQVFDAFGNPIPGVEVSFQVLAGNGRFTEGLPVHAAITDAEGQAAAIFTLGDQPGTNNHVVEAVFAGLAESPARFELSALAAAPEAETTLSGVVLDNSDQPVPGVTLRLAGTSISTLADANGTFAMSGVPTGTVNLVVDASTTTLAGDWPSLSFAMTALPGQANELGKPIRLLPLDTAGGAAVGGAADVTIPLAGVPGAELTVFAHSVTFPDDTTEGLLTFTQVHTDKVPMEPPQGTDFMLAWTVQPTGTRFDPPARISIPNSALAPGAIVDIFSFDHDLGEFVPVGTASVTEDGSQLVSNPGFGVLVAGWHGCLPPPPPTGGACSPSSCTVCPPGGGPPEPKCDECSVCEDGICNPQSIDELSCEANGLKDGEGPPIVGVDQDIDFRSIEEGDCANPTFEWDFGDGSDMEEGPTASHAYEEPGDYTVVLVARCDCEVASSGASPDAQAKNSMSVSMLVRVLKVDLVIQDLKEEDMSSPNEEDPGAWIALNNDDDDENGEPDLDDEMGGMDEDDLVMVELKLAEGLDNGEVRLEATSGGNRIKVWEEAEKMTEIDLPKTWDDVDDAPDMVWVEGVKDSASTSDIELTLIYTPVYLFGLRRGEPIEDKVKATVVSVDVDVDSDNDQGFDPPARTDDEDTMEDFEDSADQMGKIVVVNSNNDDWQQPSPMPTGVVPEPRDVVTDFADGYNRDGVANNFDDQTQMERFVPAVIELSAGMDLDLARLRFRYESSNPLAVTTMTPMPGMPEFVTYVPDAGRFRIWQLDGSAARNGNSVGLPGGGDYVPADPTWFFATELGFSSGTREQTFFVETVRPSANKQGERIVVEVDPDGEGDLDYIVVDTVRVTAVEVDLRDGATLVRGGNVAWITGEPMMPQLQVDLDPTIDLGGGADWRLETNYTHHGRADRVNVPMGGGFQSLGVDATWNLVPEYPMLAAPLADPMDPGDHVFFGGESVLTVRVGAAGGAGFESDLHFRIRGLNPEDLAARNYIDNNDMIMDMGPPAMNFHADFAYAIARHESRSVAGCSNEIYNEFQPETCVLNVNGVQIRFFKGEPINGPPNGWGLFQLDNPWVATVHQMWNWQANVRGAIQTVLLAKWRQTRGFWANQQAQAGVVLPADEMEANCTFTEMAPGGTNCAGGDCEFYDAILMKFFNSAGRCDASMVSGHYAAWDNRMVCLPVPVCDPMAPIIPGCIPARPNHDCGLMFHWDVNNQNGMCFNYVERVCNDIGAMP